MTSSDTLSIARFRALAEAYGGCLAHWPEEVREEARQRARDPLFAAILASEASLDDALDLWTVPPPAPGLAHTVVARAPVRRTSYIRRPLFWWSGIGLAAALAGGGVGAAAAAVLSPAQFVSSGISTAFGDIGPQET